MAQVRIGIVLPYLLRLTPGRYLTDSTGNAVSLAESYIPDAASVGAKFTSVSAVFEAPDAADADLVLRLKAREADRLLRQVNRLIRWYRVVTGQAGVIEITRAQANPVRFTVSGIASDWAAGVVFEFEGASPRLMNSVGSQAITRTLRKGLAGDGEPPVADLFLLDAEQARSDGRFREAVLFCWSTIDATFNAKYDALVDSALAEEWREGREWLKDSRFGLRNKMSVVLHLLVGHSLYHEPDNFWNEMTASYRKRNEIIHRGLIAQEADAELALSVARTVVGIMNSVRPAAGRVSRKSRHPHENRDAL